MVKVKNMSSLMLHGFNILNLFLPSSRCHGLKCYLLRLAGASIGKNVRILRGVNISMAGKLVVGSNTHFGEFVSILSGECYIVIGNNVDIGPHVKIIGGTHLQDSSVKAAGTDVSYHIAISDGCWLGANCVILGGVDLNSRVIVGASALVNNSFDHDTTIGGVPARVIRKSL